MKIFRNSLLAAAIPIVVLVTLLAVQAFQGSDAKISHREIVGTWKGSGKGLVSFRDDGTFEMSGIPQSAVVFESNAPADGGELSGAGKWNLSGDGGPSHTVEISFSAGGSFKSDSEATLLDVEKAGDEPQMYFDTDPDKEYGYDIRRVKK